jgi:hypothetical protein
MSEEIQEIARVHDFLDDASDFNNLVLRLLDSISKNPSNSLESLCSFVVDLEIIDADPKRVINALLDRLKTDSIQLDRLKTDSIQLDRLKTDSIQLEHYAASFCIINLLSSRYQNTFTLLNDRDVLLILKDTLISHIPTTSSTSSDLVFDADLALFYSLLCHEDLDLIFLSDKIDALFFESLLEFIETIPNNEGRLFTIIRLLVSLVEINLPARFQRAIHEQEYIQRRRITQPSYNPTFFISTRSLKHIQPGAVLHV